VTVASASLEFRVANAEWGFLSLYFDFLTFKLFDVLGFSIAVVAKAVTWLVAGRNGFLDRKREGKACASGQDEICCVERN
jgi:hypothetical protein